MRRSRLHAKSDTQTGGTPRIIRERRVKERLLPLGRNLLDGRPLSSRGVDTTTGTVFDPAIRATATMTLALPRQGLRAPVVEEHVRELYLADISVPPGLYAGGALGLTVGPIFAEGDIVQLR